MRADPDRNLLAQIENWMVPILLTLIVVVGAIRLYPWFESKFMPAQTAEVISEAEAPPQALVTTGEDDQPLVSIDTDTTEILPRDVSEVTEQRIEDLTEIVNLQPETIVDPAEVAVAPQIEATPSALLRPSDPVNATSQTTTPSAQAPTATMPEASKETVAITKAPDLAKDASEASPTTAPAPSVTPPSAALVSVDTTPVEPSTEQAQVNEPEPKPAPSTPESKIREAMTAWQQAWSTQNTTAYFAAYTPDYTDQKADRTTHARWVSWREVRITSPEFIEIDVSDVKITLQDAQSARANFIQAYRASNYQDKVAKQLDFVLSHEGWKIRREITQKVL